MVETDSSTSDSGTKSAAESLCRSVVDLVVDYMSQNDSSHDAEHILRVSRNARQIYLAEVQAGRPLESVNDCSPPSASEETPTAETASWQVVYFAALLHDLFDAKYTTRGPLLGYTSLETYLMEKLDFDPGLAAEVHFVCDHVSFSKQKKNPATVAQALARSLALRIVQDADRLDAIGAVGIARTFCFTGAMDGKLMAGNSGGNCTASRGFGETIQHFHDKLLYLQDMMNTETGKELAGERTRRMQMFLEWWDDETGQGCRELKDYSQHIVGNGSGLHQAKTVVATPTAPQVLSEDNLRERLVSLFYLS